MNDTELMLIDASGIAHQAWHVSDKEPDPGFIANTIVSRVRSLAVQHPHAAVCLDSGRSFRKDIDPAYKAQRDTENRGVIRHQIDVACETLAKDGFPIWRVDGAEADDVIASAVKQAQAIDGTNVLIVSDDKDLLQLVSDRVRVKRLTTGVMMGPSDVFDKLGVRPEQVADCLALIGDASDNIKGAEKIGKTIAPRLLSEHGTLDALYGAMARGVVAGVTLAMRTNLMEFQKRLPTVRALIALKSDVAIPFHEIATERTAPPMVEDAAMAEPFKDGDDSNDAPLPPEMRELDQNESLAALSGATQRVAERIAATDRPSLTVTPAEVADRTERTRNAQSQALAPYAGPPLDFSQQLEPRSMPEAIGLAQRMFDSRLFSDYGTPQAVLSCILAGREMGIPAMASLRSFYVRKGKTNMHAAAIIAVVLKSGKAQYFRCTERTAEKATYITKRGDDPEMSLTFTIEEGRAAFEGDDKSFKASGWGKNPADMVTKTAGSKLARLVYPDVVAGLYAPEEMGYAAD